MRASFPPLFLRTALPRRALTVMTPDDRTLLSRFAAGDPAAFAALVDRHGPLVWGVCRRACAAETLAEDAFQAVFVVLARKANGLTLRTSLANWLFGVACRVAKKAVRRELRVKQLEKATAARRPRDGSAPESDRAGPEWDDMLRVLDEELGQLPERHRGPLVACYLQGKTQDEAAVELGWSIHTLRRRLAEGRDVLRARLSRRGVTLSAGLFAGTMFAGVGFAATVPPAVAKAAVTAACGTMSASVAALAGGSAGIGVGLAAVAAVALVAGGVFLAVLPHSPRSETSAVGPSQPSPPASQPNATSPNPADEAAEWTTLRGRVVWAGDPPKPDVLTVTGADKPKCCEDGPLLSNKVLVNAANKGLQNVVVWLRPDVAERDPAFPAERIHPAVKGAKPVLHSIDQPKCQFEPRVIAARDGDSLLVMNSSPIAHNVNCAGCGLEYNRTLAASKSEEKGPLRADRFPMVLKCDIHPWMEGRVRVFDHPYFAVTDADGKFEMRHAPPGRWRMVYWHELGFHRGQTGATGFPLEVSGREQTVGVIEFDPPK